MCDAQYMEGSEREWTEEIGNIAKITSLGEKCECDETFK